MMRIRRKNRRTIIGLTLLGVIAALVFSCKREKKDFIGPDISIASNNFRITSPFAIQHDAISFTVDSNWFNASFNERVSWTIKVRGLESNAEKTFQGTSDQVSIENSTWRGGHSGLYFFKAGEQVVSELHVFGKREIWYDTSSIVAVRNNFGPDVLLWWDMDALGIARHNVVYWFDYYDGDASPPVVEVGERRMGRFEATVQTDANPLQGIYRSMEGVELSVPVNYYIGGCSHSPTSVGQGFSAPLDQVYINFYARKRTTTTSIGISLTSIAGADTSLLSYDTQTITWEGWKLVSIKLSEMAPDTKYAAPFNPAAIRQFAANLQTYTNTNVRTGFDIDYITITKGGPFNPDKY